MTNSLVPAAETVTAAGARRANSSEDPQRFVDLVHTIADQLARGREVREPSLLLGTDPVHIAADIEARAGIRRLRSLRHGPFCNCDTCRVRAVTG